MSLPTADQIAAEIRRTVDGMLASRKNDRFTDSDKDWGAGGEVGVAASMQGLRGVFGALAALPDDRELWATVKPYQASLLKEWQTAMAELAATNYGPDPYDSNQDFDSLRKEADGTLAPYVDTVAWAVSTSVMINYLTPLAETNWGVRPDKALVNQTRDEIARSVRLLINLRLDDGGWGWGRPIDLKASHIYFTWTAIQGLADYFDYVLGDSKDEIEIPPDEATRSELRARDAALEDDAAKARDGAAQFLRDAYLGAALSSNGLTFADLETRVTAGAPPRVWLIDQGSNIPLLYFYSYLLEALILSSYDRNNPAVVGSRRGEMDRLYVEIKRRFAQVRPKASAGDLDPAKSTSQLHFSGEKQRGRGAGPVNSFQVNDPGLWPQILRTLVLYPYYVERPKLPDEDIIGSAGAYALLLNDRRKDGDESAHLWDRLEFNLAITTRALEGLIDVYDYVRLLAAKSREDETVASPLPLAEMLADALYPQIRIRLQSDGEMAPAPISSDLSSVSDVSVRKVALGAGEDALSKQAAAATHLLLQRLITMDSKAVKGFVDEVIGKDHDSFSRNNPVAYQLVKTIVVVSMVTASRLFSQILQEAIFAVATDTEVNDSKESFQGETALYKRIQLALKELVRHELASDTWSVEQAIQQLLILVGTPPTPPPPTRGRRANA
ncbi:MAG: hypothetical protein ACXW5U_01260 [Thermoanaerobaculia bacterium]